MVLEEASAAVDEDGQPIAAQDSDLQRLLSYWARKCAGRQFPMRADIDPVDLRFMLERIALVEVHSGAEQRFRIRVAGSWWARRYGFEPTGIWLQDWPNPEQRKLVLASYKRLMALRRPLLLQRDHWVDEKRLCYEAALLPLAEDEREISMVLVGIGQN